MPTSASAYDIYLRSLIAKEADSTRILGHRMYGPAYLRSIAPVAADRRLGSGEITSVLGRSIAFLAQNVLSRWNFWKSQPHLWGPW
jgi:hypothetical protein